MGIEQNPEVPKSVNAMLEGLAEKSANNLEDNIRIRETFPNLEDNDTFGFASTFEDFFLNNEKTAPMIQAFHDKIMINNSVG